jgi:hypothetical protein
MPLGAELISEGKHVIICNARMPYFFGNMCSLRFSLLVFPVSLGSQFYLYNINYII